MSRVLLALLVALSLGWLLFVLAGALAAAALGRREPEVRKSPARPATLEEIERRIEALPTLAWGSPGGPVQTAASQAAKPGAAPGPWDPTP